MVVPRAAAGTADYSLDVLRDNTLGSLLSVEELLTLGPGWSRCRMRNTFPTCFNSRRAQMCVGSSSTTMTLAASPMPIILLNGIPSKAARHIEAVPMLLGVMSADGRTDEGYSLAVIHTILFFSGGYERTSHVDSHPWNSNYFFLRNSVLQIMERFN
jgi:hypothetical protein